MHSDLSPLRYPGSKSKFGAHLKKIIEHNEKDINVLVEPFVGGGSVSLFFLTKGYVKKIIISDKDRLIASFWEAVFHQHQKLTRFVKTVDLSVSEFENQKNIAQNPKSSTTDLAKACLFLNRTSFSGILNNKTGPIGGKKQNSQYGIGCRFNRNLLVEKINYLAKFGSRVAVFCASWEEALERSSAWLKKNRILNKPFYYFDPPFFYKADRLYRFSFSIDQHVKLCKKLMTIQAPWVLSYDNAPEIASLYKSYTNMHIDAPYSINSHCVRVEKELIITPLKLPDKKILASGILPSKLSESKSILMESCN